MGKKTDSDSYPSTYHCLDVWKIPSSMLESSFGKSAQQRKDLILELYAKSQNGPWNENKFIDQAPIGLFEHVIVISFFLITMGGPLFWTLILFPCAMIFGSWYDVLIYFCVTAFLALHPLPDCKEFIWHSSIVRSLYKYFTYRIVWCGDLQETANDLAPFIGAGIPHGVLPMANILSIPVVNSTLKFPFCGAAASVVFNTPFLRYMSLFGSCDASRQEISKQLKNGISVGIVADGIAGIFHCNNKDEVVNLRHRKGIAKLALRLGRPIIPCYSIGNTECFSAWFDPFRMMEKISRRLQASVFFYWGRFGLPIPYRRNITLVLAEPISVEKINNPTQQNIDTLHSKMLLEIETAFDRHKASVGWGHKIMHFV